MCHLIWTPIENGPGSIFYGVHFLFVSLNMDPSEHLFRFHVVLIITDVTDEHCCKARKHQKHWQCAK